MWQLQPTVQYERKIGRLIKKRPLEAKAVLENLNTYFETLKVVGNPLMLKFGFIHTEGMGAIAIDQKGGGGGKLKQIRLYVFAEEATFLVHLITVGDKTSQKEDVKECHKYISDLKKGV